MAVLLDTRTGPVVQGDGAADQPLRQSRMGSLVVARGHSNYFEQATRRNMFRAHAIVTAMVAFSNGTGIGGPLLWNNSQTVNAVLLGVGIAYTTVGTTTNFAIGLTGNTGQITAPSTTTAVDSSGNCYIGGPASACSVYRIGTVTNAGGFFLPLGHVHIPASLGVDSSPLAWVDLGGIIVVPPNGWISLGASAASTAAVLNTSFLWEEVPIGN